MPKPNKVAGLQKESHHVLDSHREAFALIGSSQSNLSLYLSDESPAPKALCIQLQLPAKKLKRKFNLIFSQVL